MTDESPRDSKRRTGNPEERRSSGVSREQNEREETRVASNENREMANVSHVHPYADQGAMTRVFNRGPVSTDGGTAGDEGTAAGDEETTASDSETMAEVSHTPPEGAGDSSEVFERGYEHQVGNT
ncbi:hypothetical protein ACFFQF_04275 [Haladaptatus pallidirubidus]|uniref:Uncharacterized protein n=1 Tax=Haladaptatus pallidirubidus TaxID=1008152 RepID=A0AAV3UKU8_9EURY|nr:hypothetical protein [Haladaptatus pallidirubidus]